MLRYVHHVLVLSHFDSVSTAIAASADATVFDQTESSAYPVFSLKSLSQCRLNQLSWLFFTSLYPLSLRACGA